MNNTPAVPAQKPANLTVLQRELADLAARSKLADRPAQDRSMSRVVPFS